MTFDTVQIFTAIKKGKLKFCNLFKIFLFKVYFHTFKPVPGIKYYSCNVYCKVFGSVQFCRH